MSIPVTAEYLYDLYHKELIYFRSGIYPRTMVNYDKQKASTFWKDFERLSTFINNNAGQVSPKLYLMALIEFFNGSVRYEMLGHFKSIKIYKNYKETVNNADTKDKIYDYIKRDIKFLSNYCVDNNIDSFIKYLNNPDVVIPDVIKHYTSGDISIYTLCIIPKINDIINNMDKDIVNEYLSNFFDKYSVTRRNIFTDTRVRAVSDNFHNIIDTLLKNANKVDILNKLNKENC